VGSLQPCDLWGGEYAPGDLLPGAVDAAKGLDTDRKTVLDAYGRLAEEGLVEVK
jgi:DNA-binding FadR family transcriptional regulator